MASIKTYTKRDGSRSHYVLWREDGVQTSQAFDDEGEAKRFKRFLDSNGQSLTLATKAAKRARGEGPSVADVVEEHIGGRSGIEERTREDYRRDARLHITPTLGSLKTAELTRRHVRDWVNTMDRAGCASKSIANYHGLLSASMATAVEYGYRADNPCRGVKLPTKDRRKDKDVFLETNEYAVLLAQFPAHWRAVVQLAAGTGMRWGEYTALQVADAVLDTREPFLDVNKAWKRGTDNRAYMSKPKSQRAYREVTIDPVLAELLAEVCAGRGPEEFILTSVHGGPVTYRNFQGRVWAPAVTRAMEHRDDNPRPLLRRPKIHDLRHSHASWLLEHGVEMFAVSRRLGHESIKTTEETYGHISERAQRGAAEAIGRALSGGGKTKGKKGKKKGKGRKPDPSP